MTHVYAPASPARLPHISEVNVLSIRQVLEVRVQVRLFVPGRVNTVAPPVLVPAESHVHQDGQDSEYVRPEQGAHGEGIQRCLLAEEELRPDDVAGAPTREHDRVACHLLGMAGRIGAVDAEANCGQLVSPELDPV